ncbi:MAG: hypothetical protein AB8C84_03975 [Oligoflexales bacterium]
MKIFCTLIIILAYISKPSSACPLQISAKELPSDILQTRTKHLHAYRYHKGKWHKIPLQVHLKDQSNRLLFDIKNPQLTPPDTIVIPNHHIYGQTTYKNPPCKGSGVQIHSVDQGTTYIIRCQTSDKLSDFGAVSYNTERSFIQTPHYTYQFDPLNQMLFQDIAIGGESIVKNADLMIRADFKKFFTFHFRREHIQSNIHQQQSWFSGLATQINFFLKILFFKIELALSSDLFFYPDSGHIPMVLMLPAHAKNYVHPGSGLLYSWENAHQDLNWSYSMPKIQEQLFPKKEQIQQVVKESCKNNLCIFSLTGSFKNKQFVMHFHLPKYLVEGGFYPTFVPNLQNWGQHFPDYKETPRTGVYFEASQILKGRHTWNFWIQLNKQALCPDKPTSIIKFST